MENNNFTYDKIKNFIFKNIIFIVVTLVCLTYIITGFVVINETGKSFLEILGESILVFLFSYFIIQAFSLQGILNGEISLEVILAKDELQKVKEEIGPNVSKLSNWLRIKNLETEKEIKTEALCDYGITYDQLIDNTFNKAKFNKKELKKINKIKTKKLTKLVASEVLNESLKRNDPMYLGKSKKNFLTERNFSSLTTKLIFTLIFGYFTTSFIGFNIEDFIWKLIQVVLFLIFGIMEYYKSFLFMTGDYVLMIKRKTQILREFLHYLKKGENYE